MDLAPETLNKIGNGSELAALLGAAQPSDRIAPVVLLRFDAPLRAQDEVGAGESDDLERRKTIGARVAHAFAAMEGLTVLRMMTAAGSVIVRGTAGALVGAINHEDIVTARIDRTMLRGAAEVGTFR